MMGGLPDPAANPRQRGNRDSAGPPLVMVATVCCICETTDADPIGRGPDYEYRTSPDTFVAFRCRRDGLVYLNPRPAITELTRIYPDDYHAFDFSPDRFRLIYQARRRLEGRRTRRWAKGLRPQARILDVGCGDGFHLELLREFGEKTWLLEGVDPDHRAVAAARAKGLTVHQGFVQELARPPAGYELAILNHTIEHVNDPVGVLTAVRGLLRVGGRVVITTDNTDSLDFKIFRRGPWGGYHLPRHWNLFNVRSMRALAQRAGLEVDRIRTVVSPVNWTYSVRNRLDDLGASDRVVGWFSLDSAPPLVAFTLLDALNKLIGRGALIRAILSKPVPAGSSRG